MLKVMMKKATYKALDACRSKEESRYILQGLHITENHVEATDGRMLLRASREDIGVEEGAKLGVYSIMAAGKPGAGVGGFVEIALEYIEDVEYPETDGVIPAQGKAADQISFCIMPEKKDRLSISAAMIKLYKHTGNGYGAPLLGRLAVLEESWTAGKAEKGKAARLDSGNGLTAVVLPFEVEG